MFETTIQSLSASRAVVNDCAHDNAAHCYLCVSNDRMLLDAFCESAIYALLGGKNKGDLLWRKVTDRTHADVLRYPEEAKSLNKDEYERMSAQLGYAPIDGEKRVFVVEDFDAVKPNIQNRLLKTLEEPQKGYVFLLKASGLANILPTVVSRARKLELPALSRASVRECLQEAVKAEPADLDWAAEYASGNVTRAVQLLSKPEYRGMCELVWTFLLKCESSRDLLPWYDRVMAYENHLEDLLTFFAEIFRDLMVFAAAGEGGVIAKDRLGALRTLGTVYSARASAACVGLVGKAFIRLSVYGNKQSVVDELLLGILEAKTLYAV